MAVDAWVGEREVVGTLVFCYFGTLHVWADALDCKRELERKAWMGLCV